MTADLSEFRPITYYGDESVSPTAVGPTPLAPPPPEPPAEDDSADVYPVTAEELRSVSQFGEGSEAELISPKTAYAGASWWSGAEEPFFTSRIAEDFITPPDALSGLEQIDETREEGLLESLQTALPNVLDTSKRPYNIYSMPVWTSPMWNEVGKHHVWHQRTDHPSGAFLATLFDLEQIDDDARAKDLPDLLANALRDLQEINDEADEEGMLPPSELAIANADRLIREIYDILPCQYLVELLPDGVIAITIPGGFRCSVMLLCESEGGALCSVNMNGENRRKRYPQANQLQDIFLREALSELGRE